MEKLAINGGKPIRKMPFPRHPIIGDDEKKAVVGVLESGNLSTFIASPGENFLGGVKIKEFEKKFSEFLGVKFAVAFNSATSALHSAVVAIGTKPGEEIIVPPYTFTSTATSVLMHNAIPVFSDVKRDIYCIDAEKLNEKITKLTRGIIPVHLFGHSCDMDEIMKIANEKNIKIIEDCAQAPGATYKNKKVGSIGDCGVFSFQETKNMTTGEGGMLVTNNEEIANIARMVRNHGEVMLPTIKERAYKSEILGWGYRMTELEAALGIVQLSKLAKMNEQRIELANYLTKEILKIDGLEHKKYDFVKHVYYVYSFSFNEKKIGISRKRFCDAMVAEGIPISAGYVKPLYLSPLYTEKRSFAFNHYTGNVKYEKGLCPVTELLNEKELVMTQVCRPPATKKDMDDIINAIKKVITNKDEL